MQHIPYRNLSEYIPVDLAKLRPKDAYKTLVEKRSHPVDELIKKFGKIPEELLSPRDCPNCSSEKHSFELTKDHLDLVRCNDCNIIFTNPLFREEHYDKTYKSPEYTAIVKDLLLESHDYRVERFGNERVGIMSRFLKESSPKYLDVGCATGFVVEAAKKHGWNAFGLELNEAAVTFGKARGLNLKNGKIGDEDFPERDFDAISMFDVLEHIPDPGLAVKQASQLLKQDGILFLYVPNYDSASRILMGKDAHFIWPTHHLTYFSIETISDFLRRRGFQVEWMATEGLDIADYLWWEENIKGNGTEQISKIADVLQFFVNAGAYGKNLRVIARKTI